MSRTEDVITAYESWDPDEESSTELAERLGISKARLYQILDREGITPKARRPRRRTLADSVAASRSGSPESDARLMVERARLALDSLLDEVTQLQQQLAEYKDRYGPLDS